MKLNVYARVRLNTLVANVLGNAFAGVGFASIPAVSW